MNTLTARLRLHQRRGWAYEQRRTAYEQARRNAGHRNRQHHLSAMRQPGLPRPVHMGRPVHAVHSQASHLRIVQDNLHAGENTSVISNAVTSLPAPTTSQATEKTEDNTTWLYEI